MKKILIATRNKDKFRIISKLLKSVFADYKFCNLDDVKNEIIEKKETGDIINRSYVKAKNVFDSLDTNVYEYIVGIDDGIKIKGVIIENVKEIIRDIIDDKLLNEDEIVYIVRAYTFINKKGKSHSFITEIPFKYKKIDYDLKIEKNSYPLSHVLASLDKKIQVIKLNEDDSNKYYLSYSIEKLKEVEDLLNDK